MLSVVPSSSQQQDGARQQHVVLDVAPSAVMENMMPVPHRPGRCLFHITQSHPLSRPSKLGVKDTHGTTETGTA